MFANDFGSQYGTHWNVPNFWGTQNPYFGGFGSIPQNYFGFGNVPYHHNVNNFGTQHTGWNYGQTMPQTTMPQPFHTQNWGVNYNTMPFNYGYTNQGYTPYFQHLQNFQSFQHPFQSFQHPVQNCR